ncbi:MAG: hypothetical protein ACOCZ5_00925 [bacterium]
MIKPKSYTTKEVLSNAYIGFVFEFYCSKDTKLLADELSQYTKNNVIITESEKIQPTSSSDILLKEYNNERPRYQFKVSQRSYNEIPHVAYSLLMYINEHAVLDHSTKAQVNLSFNHNYLQTLNETRNINIGKMILKIDEKFIHERFPNFKNSPFALSVKKLMPHNNYIMPNPKVLIENLGNSFHLPIDEYYGIDFTDYTYGVIKFNYIGGSDYSEKQKEFGEVLEHYILSTYQILNEENEKRSLEVELENIMENYRELFKYYHNPQQFINDFDKLHIYVDLRANDKMLESIWTNIRDPLFKILYETGIKKGKINLDTYMGIFQLRDVKMKNTKLNEIQLINCEIENCVLSNSQLWKTKSYKSRFINSTSVSNNKLYQCHLKESRVDRNNSLEKCYVHNKGEIINCNIQESIIKNAGIGKNSKIDESSVIVDTNKPHRQKVNSGVTTRKEDDITWMKKLRDANHKKPSVNGEFRKNMLKK